MKTKLKKALSVIMTVVILTGIFGGMNISFAAWSGDFKYSVLSDGTVEITDYTGSASVLTIPGKIDGYTVTSIGVEAFAWHANITSIIIPSSVTSIGEYAFCYCDSLTEITVNESNPSYSSDEYGALFNKDKTTLIQYPIGSSRTEYSIPDSVTSIGEEAFRDCDSLKSVTIPDSVTSIGDSVFSGCVSLTKITVNENNFSYSSDEYGVLFNKDKTVLIQYPIGNARTEYLIPNTVISIENSAFLFGRNLIKVEIPRSVTIIGDDAFYQCIKLTSIKIPNSVTNIGDYTFFGCNCITEISIPDSVISIGDYAFSWCNSLTGITVNESNRSYCSDEYGVLFNKNKTVLIQYPIDNSRTEYSIPHSVTSIGDAAFSGCDSLTSVKIGTNVTNVCFSAFEYCDSLENVYYTGSEEQWNNISIERNNEDLTNANIIFNYVSDAENPENPEVSDGLQIYIDNSTFNYYEGETIGISVYQIKDGEKVVPEDVKISVLNNNIVELLNVVSSEQIENNSLIRMERRRSFLENDYHSVNIQPPVESDCLKIATLKALKPGSTIIAVSSETTGETYKIPITVTSDEYNAFRADKLKSTVFTDEDSCWISGDLYVADFNYEKLGNDWHYTMNVYNGNYSCGALEVYNSDGKLIKTEKIAKNQNNNTSIYKTLENGWLLISAIYKGDTLTFRNESLYKKTPIDITVPDGGYISITTDSMKSMTCYLYNIFDIVLSTYNFADGLISSSKLSDEQIDLVSKEAIKKFISSEYYLNFAKKYADSISASAMEEVSFTTLNSILQSVINDSEALLNDVGLDLDDLCKNVLGTAYSVGEGIFIKLSNVFGVALNIIFKSSEGENLVVGISDWLKTMNKNYGFAVFSPLESDNTKMPVLKNRNVIVSTNNNVSSDTVLQTYEISSDLIESISVSGKPITTDFKVKDITLIENGKPVQPDGLVDVSIELPVEFNNNSYVIRQNEDGSWDKLNSEIENGYINFSVDHFCLFAVVNGEENNITEPTTKPNETTTEKPTEPKPSYTLGDIDGNGKITAADARIALRISAKLETGTENQLLAADTDKNGRITASDARKILRVAANLDRF